MKYSNPRMKAVIENWPSGHKRVTAIFEIEQGRKGERAVRTTDGAPKKLTFAKLARIVDGDDGRTYIAKLTEYGFVSIMRGDMKIQHENIFPNDARYAELVELLVVDQTTGG